MLGQHMARNRGWVGPEWICLYKLWNRESGWTVTKWNRAGSGAYGIGQALPRFKMRIAGPDYMTSARTQIRWGLGYILASYGRPCVAWYNSERYGYY